MVDRETRRREREVYTSKAISLQISAQKDNEVCHAHINLNEGRLDCTATFHSLKYILVCPDRLHSDFSDCEWEYLAINNNILFVLRKLRSRDIEIVGHWDILILWYRDFEILGHLILKYQDINIMVYFDILIFWYWDFEIWRYFDTEICRYIDIWIIFDTLILGNFDIEILGQWQIEILRYWNIGIVIFSDISGLKHYFIVMKENKISIHLASYYCRIIHRVHCYHVEWY